MHIKLKRIKGVRQIGPTCGIFALSMIVATYEGKGKYEYNKRVNELAYQMLDLAIAYKLTQMGEIFNSQTLQSLIDIINSSGILEKNTRIVCEKKEFDEGSLKSIILDAINNKKYIMFPYYSSCGAVRSKCSSLNMKHVHWGVIRYLG